MSNPLTDKYKRPGTQLSENELSAIITPEDIIRKHSQHLSLARDCKIPVQHLSQPASPDSDEQPLANYPFKKRPIVEPEASHKPRYIPSAYRPSKFTAVKRTSTITSASSSSSYQHEEPISHGMTEAVMQPKHTDNIGLHWVKFGSVLLVTCSNNDAELHLDKFTSGKVGRSVKDGQFWLTPQEFEAKSGLALTNDWKNSIKCSDYTMQQLIYAKILQPHHEDCVCPKCYSHQTMDVEPGPSNEHKRKKKNPDWIAKKARVTEEPAAEEAPQTDESIVEDMEEEVVFGEEVIPMDEVTSMQVESIDEPPPIPLKHEQTGNRPPPPRPPKRSVSAHLVWRDGYFCRVDNQTEDEMEGPSHGKQLQRSGSSDESGYGAASTPMWSFEPNQPQPNQPQPSQPHPYQPQAYQPQPYQPQPYQPRPYQPRPYQPRPYQSQPYQPQPYQPQPYQPQPYQPQLYQPQPLPHDRSNRPLTRRDHMQIPQEYLANPPVYIPRHPGSDAMPPDVPMENIDQPQ